MKNRTGKLTIILVVTNSCNLHCKYCYEHSKNSSSMSLDTALEIAEKEITSNPDKEIVFDFFGGEPFLEFEMIMTFCDEVWTKYDDRNIRMSCITNGTLITDKELEWLKRNKHRFFCHISVDGTPEMHAINRGECFPMNGIRKFAEIWPGHATAKMTVSMDTIGNLFSGVMYLDSLGLGVAPSLARGLEWNDDTLKIYRKELSRLVEYYSLHPEKRPVDLLNVSLAPVLLEEMNECYCGAGYSMFAYDPDGKKYPCQMFAPFSLPSHRWEAIKHTDLRADKLFYSDEDCIECGIRNLCKKCPGLNYKERGDTGKRDKRLCNFIRAEYLAAAEYKINILLKKPFDTLTRKDYIELKAAATLKEKYKIINSSDL
ncbi:MAG: 4Fe-4S cluster-binding domain-containing protein [Muribaculaceae bacterium]|nr:4Fe-4S cluster-binding domain-containing protein [Muribaculaceae bacterium]